MRKDLKVGLALAALGILPLLHFARNAVEGGRGGPSAPFASDSGRGLAETLVRPPGSSDLLLEKVAAADSGQFSELIMGILAMEDSAERDRLAAQLLRRWLAADAGSFEVFLDELEFEGVRVWHLLAPGMVEAIRDLRGTAQGPDDNLLSRIAERVLRGASVENPEGSLSWARALLAGERLDAALSDIAASMASSDPETAISILDEISLFPLQMEAATGVGLALGMGGYPLALTWAESFYSETEQSFALSGVLAGMAMRDTDRAAKEYLRVVERMKEGFREQILADREVSGGTVDEEYEGLSPEEIEKAEMAKPNPNLIYLENATRAISAELARRSPAAALDWARSMDAYQGRAFALETIYEVWAAVDPGSAFRELTKEADRRPEIAGRLFGAWAASNPRLASERALALDPGPERDFAVEGVAIGWINSGGSASQVAAWAEKLPSPSEADRVRAVVAAEAAFEDPELALRQVEQIRNPLQRSLLFQEVFPNLVDENPELARNALASIKLSPVEVEYYRSMLPR
jgi:hypothetical protein